MIYARDHRASSSRDWAAAPVTEWLWHPVAVLRLVIACLVVGCYSPSLRDSCNIECSSGSCPAGLTCTMGVCRGDNDQCPMPDGPPGNTGRLFKTIAAGDRHACAIDVDGLLVCWGANEHGQLRNIEPRLAEQIGINVVDSRVDKWLAIAAGEKHTCAISDEGDSNRVFCWGSNEAFQAGGGSRVDVLGVTEVPVPGNPIEIDGGTSHTCAVTDTAELYCWGSNSKGQIDNDTPDTPTPLLIPAINDAGWIHVSAGGESTCATNNDGKALCWGHNAAGKLGIGNVADTGTPTPIVGGDNIKAIDIGRGHACAISTESGDQDILRCWGVNGEGQIGKDPQSIGSSDTPLIPDGDGDTATWSASHVGTDVSCAIKGGKVFCWGTGDTSARGDNCQTAGCRMGFGPLTTFEVKTLAPLEARTDAFAISVGAEFGCALFGDSTTGGVARCWGDNSFGQLGNSRISFVHTASRVVEDVSWKAVRIGENHVCAVKLVDGTVWCWGDNKNGQVDPTNASTIVPSPVQVANVPAAIDVALGWQHTCALLAGDETIPDRVRCWGTNVDGQLGITNLSSHTSTPTLAAGEWIGIVSADDTTCVVNETPSATQCWGFQPPWAIGTWPTPRTLNGQEVPGDRLRLGDGSMCSLQNAGEMRCGGFDTGGMRGDGPTDTTPPSSAPSVVKLGGSSFFARDHSDIGPHGTHRCAVDLTGGTFCWGNNNRKQVSPLNVANFFDATAIMPAFTTNAVALDPTSRQIATGHEFSCAIAAGDRKVYCWGDNTAMQLTKAGYAQKDQPDGAVTTIATEVDEMTFKSLAAGDATACAIRQSDNTDEDGRLYCWGSSKKGEAGTGDSDKNHFDEVRTLRPGE